MEMFSFTTVFSVLGSHHSTTSNRVKKNVLRSPSSSSLWPTTAPTPPRSFFSWLLADSVPFKSRIPHGEKPLIPLLLSSAVGLLEEAVSLPSSSASWLLLRQLLGFSPGFFSPPFSSTIFLFVFRSLGRGEEQQQKPPMGKQRKAKGKSGGGDEADQRRMGNGPDGLLANAIGWPACIIG
jgi:hypothetical protein